MVVPSADRIAREILQQVESASLVPGCFVLGERLLVVLDRGDRVTYPDGPAEKDERVARSTPVAVLPRECESLTPESLRVVKIRLPEGEIAGFGESTNASQGWGGGSRGECSRESLPPFGPQASRVPVEGKPPGQIERLLGFERERGIEGAAEIVVLLFEPPSSYSPTL